MFDLPCAGCAGVPPDLFESVIGVPEKIPRPGGGHDITEVEFIAEPGRSKAGVSALLTAFGNRQLRDSHRSAEGRSAASFALNDMSQVGL